MSFLIGGDVILSARIAPTNSGDGVIPFHYSAYPYSAIPHQSCRADKAIVTPPIQNAGPLAALSKPFGCAGLKRSSPHCRIAIRCGSDLRKLAPRRAGVASTGTVGLHRHICTRVIKDSKFCMCTTTQWRSGFTRRTFAQLRLVGTSAEFPAKRRKLLTETTEPGRTAPTNGSDRYWT